MNREFVCHAVSRLTIDDSRMVSSE